MTNPRTGDQPATRVNVDAKLVPFRDGSEHAAIQSGSWFITHGFGKPAAGTYTEVAFTPEVQAAGHPEHVLDAAVRRVAVELYGTAWAFHYRPQERADAIERWSLRRRERVVITELEVW